MLADGSSIKLFILYTARFFYIQTYTVICSLSRQSMRSIFLYFIKLDVAYILVYIFLFFRLFGGWISFHDDDDVISPAGKQTLNKKKSRRKSSVCVFISSLFPRKNKKSCAAKCNSLAAYFFYLYIKYFAMYKVPSDAWYIYITLQFTSVSDYTTTDVISFIPSEINGRQYPPKKDPWRQFIYIHSI